MITKKEWLEQPGRLSRKIAYHTERLLSLRREADAVAKDRNPAGETEMGE